MRRKDEDSELEALYRKRFDDFMRIALAIVRDEGLARDAVQEAFARALRSRGTFRGDAPLDAWVWRIVINVARTTRRAQPQVTEPFEAGALDAAASNGRAPDFRRWVAALPERQRLVVFLRYWADLDYRSIAAVLGVEVGTVSATLNAAHKALRRTLREVSP